MTKRCDEEISNVKQIIKAVMYVLRYRCNNMLHSRCNLISFVQLINVTFCITESWNVAWDFFLFQHRYLNWHLSFI